MIFVEELVEVDDQNFRHMSKKVKPRMILYLLGRIEFKDCYLRKVKQVKLINKW
jgi:hypothetical protein